MSRRVVDYSTAIVIIVLLIAYLLAQVIMPSKGGSYAHVSNGCFTGHFSFIEPIDSTCTGGDQGFIGFPFIFNQAHTPFIDNLISFVLDLFPMYALVYLLHAHGKHKREI